MGTSSTYPTIQRPFFSPSSCFSTPRVMAQKDTIVLTSSEESSRHEQRHERRHKRKHERKREREHERELQHKLQDFSGEEEGERNHCGSPVEDNDASFHPEEGEEAELRQEDEEMQEAMMEDKRREGSPDAEWAEEDHPLARTVPV